MPPVYRHGVRKNTSYLRIRSNSNIVLNNVFSKTRDAQTASAIGAYLLDPNAEAPP